MLRISTVVDCIIRGSRLPPLEVLRISTVVDRQRRLYKPSPLEVLRISTVVDRRMKELPWSSFGSAKNFYCCRC